MLSPSVLSKLSTRVHRLASPAPPESPPRVTAHRRVQLSEGWRAGAKAGAGAGSKTEDGNGNARGRSAARRTDQPDCLVDRALTSSPPLFPTAPPHRPHPFLPRSPDTSIPTARSLHRFPPRPPPSPRPSRIHRLAFVFWPPAFHQHCPAITRRTDWRGRVGYAWISPAIRRRYQRHRPREQGGGGRLARG